MKVTIDIPDELIARLDAAQSAADNAGASYKDLTADVRQALADAYSAQAEIFAELGALVRVNALRTACVHATQDMVRPGRRGLEAADPVVPSRRVPRVRGSLGV